MNFGTPNSRQKNLEPLLDLALDVGINFIDTAEMYPSPASPETYGISEKILGKWLKSKNRYDVVLATKASGPGEFVPWIRGGKSNHDLKNLTDAVNGSLKRLQTDYIDLYQLHWPDRATNFFGQLGYKKPKTELHFDIEKTLEALSELVRTGKIRAVGLCNETAWGAMQFRKIAEIQNLPIISSIQNPYNLLNRTFEINLAEFSVREDCGLISYSPLAFGMLTGKYIEKSAPPDARLNLYSHYKRYKSSMAFNATKEYIALARKWQLDPAHMAIGWIMSKPFLTSVIIGFSNEQQLRHNLKSVDVHINNELHKSIEKIHLRIPNPCP
jgi:aryl-alcohol dehydrogenase-like predicted oxidoreductase